MILVWSCPNLPQGGLPRAFSSVVHALGKGSVWAEHGGDRQGVKWELTNNLLGLP